jgi:hypothetical protein
MRQGSVILRETREGQRKHQFSKFLWEPGRLDNIYFMLEYVRHHKFHLTDAQVAKVAQVGKEN